MPVIVPRIEQGSVAPQLSGVPRTSSPVTAEGMGGNIGAALQNASGVLSDIAHREQQKTDAAQANQSRIALSTFESSQFDPNNTEGVYSYKGANALQAPGTVQKRMDEFASKYRQGLTNTNQQAQFDQLYADHRLQILDRTNRYALGEHDKYQREAYEGAVGSALSAVTTKATAGDMAGASLAAKDGVQSIMEYGQANGQSKEFVDYSIDKFLKTAQAATQAANKANAEAYIIQNPDGALSDFSARLGLGQYSPSSQAVSSDPSAPRGIRNNNPGNIQKTDVQWQGKVDSTDPRYEAFATPEAGIRALALNAQHLQANGAQSVADLISKWSPSAENGPKVTQAYIDNVSKSMGVSPTDNINLQDPAQLQAFTQAVISHENGGNPYTPEQVTTGVQAALGKAKLRETHPPVATNGSGIIVPGSGTQAPVFTAGKPAGMLSAGNIDLMNRPVAHNADGSISTVRSISIGTDGGEVLIPTVIGGKVVSNDEAIAHYQKTGENLGTFKNVDAANTYAESLHEQQAAVYDKHETITAMRASGNPMIDALDTASTVDLYNRARAEVNRNQVSFQGSIAQREKDDTAAFKTGQGVAQPLTLADYTRAYGDKEGMQRYGAYQADQQLGHDLSSVATLTQQQMQDLASVRAPAPGENFAVKQQDHNSLVTAMQQTLEARQKDPVAWAVSANIGGFKPIDTTAPDKMAASIAERVGAATAISTQYQTPYRLMTKGESTAISTAVNGMPATDKAKFLGSLSTQLDPADYAQVINTIKDDSPTTAIAGRIMGAGRAAQVGTKGSLWWKSPVEMDAATTAQTMLEGDALLNPSKTDKDANGSPKFAMPTDSATNGLRGTWNDIVGDAFRGDGPGEMQAYQAYRAMYAGLASKAGRVDGILDSDMATKAARATIGNVDEWNGKNVIPPYGMDFNAFKDQVNHQWQAVRAGVPGADQQDADGYDLDRIGDGVYAVSNGQAPVRDKEGKLVILRIAPTDVIAPKPDKKPGVLSRATSAVGYGLSHIPLVSTGNDGS